MITDRPADTTATNWAVSRAGREHVLKVQVGSGMPESLLKRSLYLTLRRSKTKISSTEDDEEIEEQMYLSFSLSDMEALHNKIEGLLRLVECPTKRENNGRCDELPSPVYFPGSSAQKWCPACTKAHEELKARWERLRNAATVAGPF